MDLGFVWGVFAVVGLGLVDVVVVVEVGGG